MPAAKKRSTVKRRSASKNKRNKGIVIKWRFVIIGVLVLALSPFYYGYVLKSVSSAWRWFRDIGSSPHYRVYKNFNIRIPDKYAIQGIDVSYAQGNINWHKVKTAREDSIHISFAFIKATEGILTVDPYFQRNWNEATKVGIICGAYHFFRPKKGGKWQSRFFLQNVNIKKGNLPAVVDVEVLDGVKPDKMRAELLLFLKQVEAKTGVKPIIYSGLSFYQDYLAGYFNGYALWLAHYRHPELKVSGVNWQFWQHSDNATVNGINHIVDFDAFRGDSLAFRNFLVP